MRDASWDDADWDFGDPLAVLAGLDEAAQRAVLARMSPPQKREMIERWHRWAHGGQLPDMARAWRVWLIMAGRGFGKTRAGAEWVSGLARADGRARIALVGATLDDVRKVMVEGESGLIAVARTGEAVRWQATTGTVQFASGASAYAYSAEIPERLRGPEHHFAWCDELAKWRLAEAWDNLLMGLRLGNDPRVMVTTTPRPVPLLKRIIAAPGTELRSGGSGDNPHLPSAFLDTVRELYGGTRLGRQEIDGQLIEDIAGALWTRATIERQRVRAMPAAAVVRVVVAVDPPAGIGGDACGIVAAAKAGDGCGYVIEDASVAGLGPEGWARAVAGCAARHGADRVVAEANNGGAMVDSVLRAADAGLPVKLVHASRGKVARAEPVAALYARGRVFHVGAFPALEDELCGLVQGGGYAGPGRSPDRADALVWAMTELMLGRERRPGVRGI